MKLLAAGLALAIAGTVAIHPMFGSGNSFDAIVSAVETQYHQQPQHIPMLWLADAMTAAYTGGGVRHMKLAEFDNFSGPASTEELDRLIARPSRCPVAAHGARTRQQWRHQPDLRPPRAWLHAHAGGQLRSSRTRHRTHGPERRAVGELPQRSASLAVSALRPAGVGLPLREIPIGGVAKTQHDAGGGDLFYPRTQCPVRASRHSPLSAIPCASVASGASRGVSIVGTAPINPRV